MLFGITEKGNDCASCFFLSGQQEAPNPQDSVEKPSEVRKLIAEGQHLIKKRQKLIKIADRNKDGWLVVQEYESDDLASDSEDEKKLRKAKVAAERNRKEAKSNSGNAAKKLKSTSDSQLFRGKVFYLFTL